MGEGVDDDDAGGGDVDVDVHPVVGLLKVHFAQEYVGGRKLYAQGVDRVEEA